MKSKVNESVKGLLAGSESDEMGWKSALQDSSAVRWNIQNLYRAHVEDHHVVLVREDDELTL